jgi:hypothetical protein
MWIQWIAMASVLTIVSLGIAAIYGRYRWQLDTDRLRTKLTSGQQSIKPRIYDSKEIEDLLAPV